MPDPLICPACGKRYDLPAEFLTQNAGLDTECECGQAIPIPAATAQLTTAPALAYAAPDFPPKPIRGVWSDGCMVVVARGTRMPSRCCVCNQPVDGEILPQTLRWIAPEHRVRYRGGGVAGLFIVLFGTAISDSYSQSIVVRLGRCQKHRWVFKPLLTGWILLGCMVTGIIGTCAMGNRSSLVDVALIASFACGLLAFIAFRIPPRIRITNFRADYAWLSGFGDDYILGLPEFADEIDSTRQRTVQAIEQIFEEE